MKLIIQIPCFNEEKTISTTLNDLPREIDGIDSIEWLIINDGSTDNTVQVAIDNGVDHIVDLGTNKGLAHGFMAGLHACIERGADIIVNTDADNQYSASFIPELIKPIINKEAEIVVGERPISKTSHFSIIKKLLQKFGSFVVRMVSNTNIPDAPSGFRAFSREAAMRLNVFNEYTYTLETIIQAGMKNISITSVPVLTNEDLRPSRLVKSIFSYVRRSIVTIVRIFVIYKPFRFFGIIGCAIFLCGFLVGCRFLYYYAVGEGGGHLQSLILSSILISIGFQTMTLAFIADLLSVNRKLLEELVYRQRKK